MDGIDVKKIALSVAMGFHAHKVSNLFKSQLSAQTPRG